MDDYSSPILWNTWLFLLFMSFPVLACPISAYRLYMGVCIVYEYT